MAKNTKVVKTQKHIEKVSRRTVTINTELSRNIAVIVATHQLATVQNISAPTLICQVREYFRLYLNREKKTTIKVHDKFEIVEYGFNNQTGAHRIVLRHEDSNSMQRFVFNYKVK